MLLNETVAAFRTFYGQASRTLPDMNISHAVRMSSLFDILFRTRRTAFVPGDPGENCILPDTSNCVRCQLIFSS
jgi:hypothetical protein